MGLFDKRIPILPLGSKQEKYQPIISKFGDLDQSYVFNASCPERRGFIESAYNNCADYLDRDFREEIKLPGKFVSRLWELQLCSVLLSLNYKLIKPPVGRKKVSRPDFCVIGDDNKKIWIEAVCPQRGDVPEKEEMVSGVIYTRTGNIQDDLNIVSPRITSALKTKYLKRKDYNDSKDFSLDDRYIIAINTHHFSHYDIGGMAIEYVLYGMGLQYMKQTGETGRQFHWETQKKKNEETVGLDIAMFFREEYVGLSAVIISSNWFNFGENFERSMSESMITYLNHRATNVVDSEEINFGNKKMMCCEEDICELKEI